jgi:hypothetical protein
VVKSSFHIVKTNVILIKKSFFLMYLIYVTDQIH